MKTKMKRAPISKHFSKEQIAAAIDAAPEYASDNSCGYDPNDPEAVAAFWAKAKVRLPGQRGPQKFPTKVAVTVRYSPDVLAYFKASGEGWQTRMNDALREYVKKHRRP